MLNNIQKISLIAALLVSSSSMASVSTADINFSSINNANSFSTSVTIGGETINLNVSAWADSGNMANDVDGDNKIELANTVHYTDGWGIINKDEYSSGNCGNKHTADNYGTDCSLQDYDFFLFEFSESVSLTQATYGWLNSSSANTQVSIAALSDSNLANRTWEDVKDNQLTAANSSGWAQVQGDSGYGSGSYYTNFSNARSGVQGISSQYWILGALNSAFGGTRCRRLHAIFQEQFGRTQRQCCCRSGWQCR